MSPVDMPGGPARSTPPSATQAWRWLAESVWRVEHAFERSRAEGRVADDTRLRIFFILAIFALAFVTLGIEAGRAALFSKAGGEGGASPVPAEARADLVDRDGRSDTDQHERGGVDSRSSGYECQWHDGSRNGCWRSYRASHLLRSGHDFDLLLRWGLQHRFHECHWEHQPLWS